jgi:small conductance mechanosensitive channel
LDVNEPLRWLLGRGALLLVGAAILLLLYRVGVAGIHRVVPTAINAQAHHLPSGSSSADEVGKRIGTIEDLLLKLLRVAVLASLVALALAVFELWTILGAIVLLIVAIVFATRDVVLDYVMGFLILVEGPYFRGDYVAVGGHPGIEGVVEEIGLRRTMLRDGVGSSHAVSNGLIRLSSNRTRLFSVAAIDVQVLHPGDLERALAVAGQVADEMRGEAGWVDRIATDVGADVSVTAIGADGASIRLQQRVRSGDQAVVASELRRRLAAALVAESIVTGQWELAVPTIKVAAGSPQG